MFSGRHLHSFLAFIIVAAIVSGALGTRQQSASAAPAPTGRQDFGALAPAFVPNAGEVDRTARFLSVGGGRAVFFTHDGVRIVDARHQRSLWLTFADADAARIEGESPTGGLVTFLHGRKNLDGLAGADGSRVAYHDVVYRRLWPGIDARITGASSGLKYSFEISPYGDPQAIHLRYEGADRLALTSDGALTIDAGDNTMVDGAPTAYQQFEGRTVPVDVRFALRGTDVGLVLGPYDHARPLVVDPTLAYSTFLGSSGYDAGHAIAVDALGSAYVAGTTRASDFPATPGAYQTTFRGGSDNLASDAFVAKINAAGTAFDYVTYLGGSGNDEAFGVAVDASGQAYVAGYTESDDFPTTSGAFQRAIGLSHHDGFLAKLDGGGAALVYATFFGANGSTDPAGVAVDLNGNAYVTGRTFANNVLVSPGAQLFSGGGSGDGFLLKFEPTGASATFGTYIGGPGVAAAATSVAVDVNGYAFVTGWTRSSGTSANRDAFVWKLDTSASVPKVFATSFGGSLDDTGVAVAIDPAGKAVVAVATQSTDFPTTASGPVTNSALVRISSDGTALTSSTYVGASASAPAVPAGVAVDRSYNAYVAGAYGVPRGIQGIWMERIDLSGAANATFTLQGQHSNVGPAEDVPAGISLGPTAGDVFITGSTTSTDFPTTPGAPQPQYGSGASDAFVSKISFGGVAQPLTNLALHKPVFVSSEFSPQFAGRFAVDGDPTTRWSSGFSNDEWIYVDLEQTIAVGEVILRWETAYGADYQVQMSNDAQTWTTIRSVTAGDGGVDDLTGLSGSGRYLRILGTRRGTQWGYSLFELEVYGAPDSPPLADLARHRPAVASSVAFNSSSYVASNAVDGDPASRWSSAFTDDQWIYVDLTEIYTVNEVILRWETAFGADYQVQMSDDASTWKTIRTVTGGNGGVDDLTGLSGTGRYVRILGTRRGTEWGYSLWSFEVYGNEVRSASANDMAAHRPAIASSVAFGDPTYAASNAVDGNPATRWSSAFSDPQWIYVDLGQPFILDSVRLSWETAYAADFQVQISNDATNWTSVQSVTNNTAGTNDLPVSGTGRYVRVYGTRRGTEWGYSLWSFEVYGDPAP
jgi:hypothetical protein